MTPYQNYMWNGMTSLFIKIEQNNLWNEINFNLYTTDPSNATSIRRTIDGFVCPSNRRPTTVNSGTGPPRPPARAVRLPRQHGRRVHLRHQQQLPEPDAPRLRPESLSA